MVLRKKEVVSCKAPDAVAGKNNWREHLPGCCEMVNRYTTVDTLPREIIYKVRDDLVLSTVLLYERIRLSGLDTGGSRGRHPASWVLLILPGGCTSLRRS